MPRTAPPPSASIRLARFVHRRVVDPVLSFLLPSLCFVCSQALGHRQCLGACSQCWTAIRTLPSPRCPGCALPRPGATDLVGPANGRCAACVLHPGIADRVFAAVAYDAVARRFLLRAKFGRRPELLQPLGAQLARSLEIDRFARDCTLVAAVPSLPWVTLSRGFSPAVELARPVARCLNLPLYTRMVRRRIGLEGPAKRMGARARRLALRTAFAVRGALEDERVLLIDDVLTTGATADSCVRALREAGASEVRVGVWARTLPRWWSGAERV